MARNNDREDFLTDYDPNWGNDDERDWADDDNPAAADATEDEDEELRCGDCGCDPDRPDPVCECPCHRGVCP